MALKVLYWTPRILSVLAILFLMMFSLDAFEGSEPFGKQFLGFLAHNIPAFVLIIALVAAWKREIIGGVLFIVLSFAMAIFFGAFTGNGGSLMIIAPFFLAGLFFIMHKVLAGEKK